MWIYVISALFFLSLSFLLVYSFKKNKRKKSDLDNIVEELTGEMAEKVIFSVPDMIFIVDSDYTIRRVLNCDPEKLSVPPEMIIGLHLYDAVDKECADEIMTAIRRALSSDEVQEVEYTISFKDSKQYFEGRFKRIQEGFVACFERNITERKAFEEELRRAKENAEASDKLKSVFISNMSHEIRTPLNAIVGFSDLLSETEDPKEKAEFISVIRRNNELLLQLINDILDLSKIEADMLEFTYTDVDINDLLKDLEMSCNFKAGASSKVKLVFVSPLERCVIHTEKNRIQQVLINLINNAFKFTDAGEIRVGYELLEKEMRFFVSDTGKGIPADKQEEIFNRFVKLDNFINGTGLGLSICQTILNKLNGGIGVESTEGVGSTFWFTLPVMPLAAIEKCEAELKA